MIAWLELLETEMEVLWKLNQPSYIGLKVQIKKFCQVELIAFSFGAYFMVVSLRGKRFLSQINNFVGV